MISQKKNEYNECGNRYSKILKTLYDGVGENIKLKYILRELIK